MRTMTSKTLACQRRKTMAEFLAYLVGRPPQDLRTCNLHLAMLWQHHQVQEDGTS
jgi:hypothetical protein